MQITSSKDLDRWSGELFLSGTENIHQRSVKLTTSDSFTRDKFSGPRPKRPNLKLTPSSLLVNDSICRPGLNALDAYVNKVHRYFRLEGCVAYFNSKWKHIDESKLPTISSVETNRLMNSSYAKVVQPDFDLPVFLAELKETLLFIRNPLKGLLKYFERKGIKNLLRLTNDTWLQYRYGVRPMIADMNSAYSAMNNSFHRYADIIRKASAHSQVVVSHKYRECWTNDSEFLNYVSSSLNFKYSVDVTTSVETTASTFYTWLFTRYAPVLGILQGPGVLAGTLWETIPLSFVVDWFVGVGDFLSTFRYTPGLLIKGYTLTQVQRFHRIVKCLGFQYMNYRYTYTLFDDQFEQNVCRKLRTLPSGLPGYPALNLYRFDLKHLIDYLSLNTQRVLRGK